MYSYGYARKYRISFIDVNNNFANNPAAIIESTTDETSDDESSSDMDLESDSSNSDIMETSIIPGTTNVYKTMEFVLINVELVNKVTNRKLYGFVELNVPGLPLDYKHRMCELLTNVDIYNKLGIKEQDLPEGIRSTKEFKSTLIIDKTQEISSSNLKGIITEKQRPKYATMKREWTKDVDKEMDIILGCVKQWKIKMRKTQKIIKSNELIPLLFIDRNNSGHRVEWAYPLRIKPLGYDAAVVFKIRKDMFEFRRVLLDWEEVRNKHRLLGNLHVHYF